MSFRKLLLLPRALLGRPAAAAPPAAPRPRVLAAPLLCRYFTSNNNLGNKNKPNDTKPDPNSIIGKLFPQASQNEALEIKKEQERFEKESKEKNEENAKSWRRMKITFAVFGVSLSVSGGLMVYEMGAPRRDEDGEVIMDEYIGQPVLLQYLKRTWKELTFYEKMIKEPSREKLLPEPMPAPYQPTYTLVLEFTDVLVHPDWSYQTGWRFKKRPGVDAFLQAVAASDYEVIVFTTENAFMIWPVLDKLDPENKFITYRLFRDSTHFIDGVHVKNLDGLNRDLSKVIVVDWNKEATKFHGQNSLILKKWKGADDDTTLLDLASLLQTIAMSNVEDVREVLTYYGQFDDPIAAYRENQRKLMEQMEERERETKSPSQPLTQNWIRSFTRR